MNAKFYEKTTVLSPGDILGPIPYARVPKPLKIARKFPGSLKGGRVIEGELRQVFEFGKHNPNPPFDFDLDGEDVLVKTRMSRVVFLTWGSDVDSDRQDGGLHKKDWLVAPVFPLGRLKGGRQDPDTGEMISYAQRVREGRNARFFPLPPLPGETDELYVDFRKICPVAATYFDDVPRVWHLAPQLWNDCFNHLMWFFTRRRIFFGPVPCPNCQTPVDTSVTFQGQSLNPEDDPDTKV